MFITKKPYVYSSGLAVFLIVVQVDHARSTSMRDPSIFDENESDFNFKFRCTTWYTRRFKLNLLDFQMSLEAISKKSYTRAAPSGIAI
jgi:hypothetical protein